MEDYYIYFLNQAFNFDVNDWERRVGIQTAMLIILLNSVSLKSRLRIWILTLSSDMKTQQIFYFDFSSNKINYDRI